MTSSLLMWKERRKNWWSQFHLRICYSYSVGRTARVRQASLSSRFRSMACFKRGSEAAATRLPASVVVGSLALEAARCCLRRCRHCWDTVAAIAKCRPKVHTSGLLPDSIATAIVEAAVGAGAIVRVRRLPRPPGAARPPGWPGAARRPGSWGQQLSAAPSTVTAASAFIHFEIHLQPHYWDYWARGDFDHFGGSAATVQEAITGFTDAFAIVTAVVWWKLQKRQRLAKWLC